MKDEIRILMAEDFPPDAELNEREISKSIPNCHFKTVSDKTDFIHALEHFNPHVVVSDFSMPQFNGLEALKLTLDRSQTTPFILCTGSVNEETAVECMRQGATDYIIKEHNKRLGNSVAKALELRNNLLQKAHKETQEFLRKKDQQILMQANSQLLFSTNSEEVSTILFDAAKKILPDSILVLSKVNMIENYGQVKLLYGVDRWIPWLSKILNPDLYSFKTPLSADRSENSIYYEKKLIRIEGGLFFLMGSVVSKSICRLIEKALKIKEIYHIGISYENTYHGGLTLILSATLSKEKANLIEIIVKQASQALAKLDALEDAKRKGERLKSLLRISQLNTVSIKEFLEKSLEEIVQATLSKYGFLCRYNSETSMLDMLCTSKNNPADCKINITPQSFHLDKGGLWSEAIHQKKPLLINNYQNTPSAKSSLPVCNDEINNILIVPIYDHTNISGLITVANKENGYEACDIEHLTLMFDAVWKWIKQKMVDQILYQNREKLRTIVELSPIGMASFNHKGDLSTCNSAFKDIFGLNPDSEPSCSLFDPILIDEKQRIILHEGKALKIEKTISKEDLEKLFDVKLIHSEKLDLEINIKSTHADNGKHKVEYIFQVQNISERKQMDQAKNDFVNTISHEMRTPLTSIQQSVLLIQKYFSSNISKEQKNLLEIAIRNSNRLAKLIQNVLDYQKLNSFQMDFNKEASSINELITQLMEDLSSFTSNQNIPIETNLEANLPLVFMDRDRISQVLINLISNAVKFTPKGKITIATCYCPNESRIKVSVSDTGIGISQENVTYLSQPFFQVKDTLSNKKTGTGLGLSICRKILNNHNTDLFVKSKLGEGSTFFFFLSNQNLIEDSHFEIITS